MVNRPAGSVREALAGISRARLLIVNVLEKRRLSGGGSHERVDQARSERETLLVKTVRDARDTGVTAEFLVWEGDPGDSIAAAAEAEEAKDEFTVMLTGVGDKKIQVIKEIRAITALGLKEAKELVEKAPTAVKEDIPKEEAEQIKAKLEEQGAAVGLK